MPVIDRLNVHEGKRRIVLINLLGVGDPSDDLAEDAVAGAHDDRARRPPRRNEWVACGP